MFGEKKIIFAIIWVILLQGCITTKNSSISAKYFEAKKIIENTIKNNITEVGFYIKSGRISFYDGQEKMNFLFSVKYEREKKYLISIKSTAGIEAIRIYLDNDTMLINDRINKEVLYGKSTEFEKITGVKYDFLKVCFGDLPGNYIYKWEKINGGNEHIELEGNYNGILFNSLINCNNKKPENTVIYIGGKNRFLKIEYEKYKGDLYQLPHETIIYDSEKKIKMILRIKKYIVPWHGDIEFIPGEGYRKRKFS